ncbi:hypothetical protein ACHAXA_002214 [Cyclostephanos tholiformis]|uniref:Uncharacterized protein n=1 Tax=Cyclostephanos tholiformis TaxID=382380 RepID=A0ABD3RWX8_9STRA
MGAAAAVRHPLLSRRPRPGEFIAITIFSSLLITYFAYVSSWTNNTFASSSSSALVSHVPRMEGGNFVYPPVVFGHVHMTKTAGSEINGVLSQRFDRVCGHKGYSYDAHSVSERTGGGYENITDSIAKSHPGFHRARVPLSVMNEIGYHDCDWVSHEAPKHLWNELADQIRPWPLELHVPCREPIGHLMSQCNHLNRNFQCKDANLTKAVRSCLLDIGRYSDSMGLHENITVKCFDPIPIENYVKYMSHYLQPRRIAAPYVHIESNPRPRDKTKECIWNRPDSFKQEVLNIMMKIPYYRFCSRCMGSNDDLLAIKP